MHQPELKRLLVWRVLFAQQLQQERQHLGIHALLSAEFDHAAHH
jgi:hypothetical protein